MRQWIKRWSRPPSVSVEWMELHDADKHDSVLNYQDSSLTRCECVTNFRGTQLNNNWISTTWPLLWKKKVIDFSSRIKTKQWMKMTPEKWPLGKRKAAEMSLCAVMFMEMSGTTYYIRNTPPNSYGCNLLMFPLSKDWWLFTSLTCIKLALTYLLFGCCSFFPTSCLWCLRTRTRILSDIKTILLKILASVWSRAWLLWCWWTE